MCHYLEYVPFSIGYCSNLRRPTRNRRVHSEGRLLERTEESLLSLARAPALSKAWPSMIFVCGGEGFGSVPGSWGVRHNLAVPHDATTLQPRTTPQPCSPTRRHNLAAWLQGDALQGFVVELHRSQPSARRSHVRGQRQRAEEGIGEGSPELEVPQLYCPCHLTPGREMMALSAPAGLTHARTRVAPACDSRHEGVRV